MSTSTKKIVWFGMKVTPEQKAKIKKLAKQKGLSQKEAVMELIENEVDETNTVAEPGSFLEAAQDLIGSESSYKKTLRRNPLQAIEFESNIYKKNIRIPEDILNSYSLGDGEKIRVILLMDNSEHHFQHSTAVDFFKGYADSDAIYDDY